MIARRIGVAAHPVPADAVRRDERIELGDHIRMASELEVRVDSLLERAEPDILELGGRDLREALADLVLSEATIRSLGPAINSGRGLFLYGPPGNGKTSMAERITRASSRRSSMSRPTMRR